MAEELEVVARARDELSRPVDRMADSVDNLGDKAATTNRQLGRSAVGAQTLGGRLRSANRHVNTFGRGIGRLAGTLGRGLITGAKLAGAAIVGLGAAAIVGGAKLATMASDAEEIASKFGVVFDDSAKAAEAWVQRTNAAYGIAKTELRDMAAGFGVFGQAAGLEGDELRKFSTSLSDTALDLASFHNVAPEEAALALRSGLAGEAEPLKRFGILLNETAMKTKAASMGMTGELTEQQKVMVRQALIMDGLGAAQGDLARTSDSTANRMKALRGRLRDLGEEVGGRLTPLMGAGAGIIGGMLPAATDRLTSALDRTLPTAKELEDGVANLIARGRKLRNIYAEAGGGLEGFRGILNDLLPAGLADLIGDVATVVSDLIGGFLDGKAALPLFLSPLGILKAVIGWLADNGDIVRPFATALGILVGIVGLWTAAQWLLNAALTANPIGIIVVLIAALIAGLVAAYQRSETFRAIVDAVAGVLRAVFGAIGKVIGGIGRFVGGVAKAIGKSEAFQGALDGVKTVFGGVRDAAGWVVDKVRQVIDWLGRIEMPAALQAIIDGVGNIGGAIGGAVGNLFGGARAAGGPTAGGKAYLVGERGPELHVPNRNGWVIPNHELAGLAAKVAGAQGGDGGTYTAGDTYDVAVSFTGPVNSEVDVERAVRRAIRKAERDKAERTVGRRR